MKKILRNNEGVSPWLAIAILITITVVIGSTLYVMTSGYMSAGSSYAPTPRPYDYTGYSPSIPDNSLDQSSSFVNAKENDVSTFGADVDTGSYGYTRNCINSGRLPEPENVRTEEFLNYFDYHYPEHQEGSVFKTYVEAGPSYFSNDYSMLKIGIRAKSISAEERPPMTIICVIDTSGSMYAEGKLDLIKEALPYFVDQMISGDKFGIVTYGSTATRYLEPLGIESTTVIKTAIRGLYTEGSTNAQDGLIKGYEMANDNKEEGKPARLLLLSDGVANTGVYDVDGLVAMVNEYKANGIYLSTYGFGMGVYNDQLMEQLADNGDGKYAYIDSLDEAKKQLVEDSIGNLVTVAKDLKIKVEFNQDIVEEYRLLGYDNRLMTEEEFEDETKDSGDVGAGHTVTALYEFKLRDVWGNGVIATLHLTYKDPETEQSHSKNYNFHKDIIESDISRTTPHYRFALSVAELAENLKGIEYSDSEISDITDLAQDAIDEFVYTASEEQEFVDLLKDAELIVQRGG